MEKVGIYTDFIKLEQMMKLAGLVESGADAKALIQEGNVKVNGSVELQRGKKLRQGDQIEFEGIVYEIEQQSEESIF